MNKMYCKGQPHLNVMKKTKRRKLDIEMSMCIMQNYFSNPV